MVDANTAASHRRPEDHVSFGSDAEKAGIQSAVRDANDKDSNNSDDSGSQYKQDGVKRVEAITTVWSKELMIVMFVV